MKAQKSAVPKQSTGSGVPGTTGYALAVQSPGGPEAMVNVPYSAPDPDVDEVRIRHEAIGLNFIDTYHRRGIYVLPEYPAILGMEAAGVVIDAGANSGFAAGQRVAYVTPTPGSYATARTVSKRYVCPLPEAVETHIGAAVLLKGLTARYLLKDIARIKGGSTILVYAAAGGVGSLLVQWAKHLGATVIGTAGSEEKATRAAELGSHHVIRYDKEDVAKRVRETTGDVGVDVVFDSVGAPMFGASLGSLRRRGLLIAYGQSSGEAPTLTTSDLARAGSVFLTRPRLWDYVGEPGVLQRGAHEIFELVSTGVLRVDIGATLPLREVALAHRELEGRRTRGSVVLLP